MHCKYSIDHDLPACGDWCGGGEAGGGGSTTGCCYYWSGSKAECMSEDFEWALEGIWIWICLKQACKRLYSTGKWDGQADVLSEECVLVKDSWND